MATTTRTEEEAPAATSQLTALIETTATVDEDGRLRLSPEVSAALRLRPGAEVRVIVPRGADAPQAQAAPEAHAAVSHEDALAEVRAAAKRLGRPVTEDDIREAWEDAAVDRYLATGPAHGRRAG